MGKYRTDDCFVLRSGEMPLLLFCLLACFHRDVPADMFSLWRTGAAVSGETGLLKHWNR